MLPRRAAPATVSPGLTAAIRARSARHGGTPGALGQGMASPHVKHQMSCVFVRGLGDSH